VNAIRRIARRRVAIAAVVAIAATLGSGSAVDAHGPDPLLGGSLWSPNQSLAYQWRSGEVPPAWMQTAIQAGATDSNASRASRAGSFTRVTSGSSVIGYADPYFCASAALACMSRASAPSSFAVFFTAEGHVFDWGVLHWCQGPVGYVNGCYDVENLALDELGHVEDLGHHVNYSNGSDYLDAVVQTVSASRPNTGWNRHGYGRCDVARLQLEYDRPTTSALFSKCLALATTTSLTASSTSVSYRGSVTFAATLKTISNSNYLALSNDYIAGRSVVLQWRLPGSPSWTTFGSMSLSGNTYVTTASLTVTYEWRAVFSTPSTEGLSGSSSSAVTVKVGPCYTQCPVFVVAQSP
jgi:hypothetical protein